MIENLTIEQTSKLLNDKQASALEITDIYLKKINTAKKLNCFITVSEDKAIEAAKEIYFAQTIFLLRHQVRYYQILHLLTSLRLLLTVKIKEL